MAGEGFSNRTAYAPRTSSHYDSKPFDANEWKTSVHVGTLVAANSALSSLRDSDQRCTSDGPS